MAPVMRLRRIPWHQGILSADLVSAARRSQTIPESTIKKGTFPVNTAEVT